MSRASAGELSAISLQALESRCAATLSKDSDFAHLPQEKSLYSLRVRGFFFLFAWFSTDKVCLLIGQPAVYPLIDPLQPGNALDEAFHALGAVLLHLLRYMTVNVQGESRCVVAQVFLHRFDVVPASEGGHGIAMAEIC